MLATVMEVDAFVQHDGVIGLKAPTAPLGWFDDHFAAAFDHGCIDAGVQMEPD